MFQQKKLFFGVSIDVKISADNKILAGRHTNVIE